jgi:hypothetical protein
MCNMLPLVRLVASALLIISLPTAGYAQSDPWNTHARPKRVDISGSGGFLLSTDWSDLVLLGSVSPVTGALEQVLVRDLAADPGPVYDATVTYWEGRYGFRAHAGFASSCLAIGRSCGDFATAVAGATRVDMDTYVYDIGGAIGLLDYRPQRWVWPYVFFGFGGVTYNLDRTVGPPLTFIERRPAGGSASPVVVVGDPDPLLIAIDELGVETQFAFNVGIGSDFRIPLGPASVGIRLELSDHLHNSPIEIEVEEVDALSGLRTPGRVSFGAVHNLRAAAGIVLHFGR